MSRLILGAMFAALLFLGSACASSYHGHGHHGASDAEIAGAVLRAGAGIANIVGVIHGHGHGGHRYGVRLDERGHYYGGVYGHHRHHRLVWVCNHGFCGYYPTGGHH